jgi:hypothetical protein
LKKRRRRREKKENLRTPDGQAHPTFFYLLGLPTLISGLSTIVVWRGLFCFFLSFIKTSFFLFFFTFSCSEDERHKKDGWRDGLPYAGECEAQPPPPTVSGQERQEQTL